MPNTRTDTQPNLAALLGSRICHDLISPLGAIGNGVELLTMGGDAGGPELALISESVESANARIRFFRIAFGAAAQDTQIAGRELHAVLRDYAHGARVGIDWQAEGDINRALAKLVFLLIQCLEVALPFGGNIAISNDMGRWRLTGRGEKIKVAPDLWEVLSNPSASHAVGPAEVQFALAPTVLADLDRKLTVEIGDAGITLSF